MLRYNKVLLWYNIQKIIQWPKMISLHEFAKGRAVLTADGPCPCVLGRLKAVICKPQKIQPIDKNNRQTTHIVFFDETLMHNLIRINPCRTDLS